MSIQRAVPLITVSDLDAAIEAYRRITGMEVIMNHGWIATLSPPGDRSVQISLITSDPTASVNPSVSVEVDDLDGAYRIVRESGWEIVHDLAVEEWGGYVVSSFGMLMETSLTSFLICDSSVDGVSRGWLLPT